MATIVLLHGWGRGSKSFGILARLLEDTGHAVYTLDLPGFGVAAPPPYAWGVGEYADFLRAFIREKNLEHFYLFGHSFGGQIGIRIAAEHPEGLQGLILAGAAGIRPRPGGKIIVFGFLSKVGKAIFSLPSLFIFREWARKFVYLLSGERDYYHLQSPVMREVFQKVVREDMTDYFPKITVPTFIIWGKKDKMTPVRDAYVMYKGIPGSRLEILDDVNHTPHVEAPERVAELVDVFMRRA